MVSERCSGYALPVKVRVLRARRQRGAAARESASASFAGAMPFLRGLRLEG